MMNSLNRLSFFLFLISNNDFFMLHGCTGLFAVRNILQHIDNGNRISYSSMVVSNDSGCGLIENEAVQFLQHSVTFLVADWVSQGLVGSKHPALKQGIALHTAFSLHQT
jgi:hypothetical protein